MTEPATQFSGGPALVATSPLVADRVAPYLPDHTQLPESDGSFVKNFQEHPQSILLTDSIGSTLEQLHPDGYYAIGQDCGIYWREANPPEQGAEAPDWFYVPNVPPKLAGKVRRSYVLWREFIAPAIALEFASGNGEEERDTTPLSYEEAGETIRPGKFWVYERIMRIPYYGIFMINSGELEMYELIGLRYYPMQLNSRGHYTITPMGVEIGVWQGSYQNQTQAWLRWWDLAGNLLLTGQERAIAAEKKVEVVAQQLNVVEERAAKLAERLRSMGIDPDTV